MRISSGFEVSCVECAFSDLFLCVQQRLPIKKKVAWEDLGVARRIFTDRAITMDDKDDNLADTDDDNRSQNGEISSDESSGRGSPTVRILMEEMEEVLSHDGNTRGREAEQ